MQQSIPQQTKPGSQRTISEKIYKFIQNLKQKQTKTYSIVKKIIKKDQGYGHALYPIKLRLKKVKNKEKSQFVEQIQGNPFSDIRQKLQKRAQKLQTVKQKYKLLKISDLLVWSIPNCCQNYISIQNYIRKWKQKQLQISSPIKSQKKLPEQRISTSISQQIKQDTTQLNVLQSPLNQIRQFFQSFYQINAYYEQMEKEYTSILMQQKDQNQKDIQTLKYLVNLTKLEQNQIKNRIKQSQKVIAQIDKGLLLDPEVLKHRLIMHQYKQPNRRQRVYVKFGLRLKFISILKVRVKKAQKRLHERDNLIVQIMQKQKLYIDTLITYIQNVKKPIQALNILSIDQIKSLFCNIQQIKQIHVILYQKLLARHKNHRKQQTYGDIMKQIIPFFKMYVDYQYILTAQAPKIMLKLIQQNQAIRQICHKFFLISKKKASDEMNQPHQKILSYSLHFKQIIQKTNPSHKDHKLFQQALASLELNLRSVQQTVDKISKTNRFYQLQQQFGSPQSPIYQKSRIFIDEFTCYMIKQQRTIKVLIFCFNDLILIVEEQTRKKLKHLKVDEKFYIRREQDNKVYKNMIKVHSSQGFLTLTTGDDKISYQIATKLYDSLKNIQIKTQNNQLVYIHVLGTQQIGSTSFAKYTQYIIQVRYMSLKKLLHLRFSQIIQIVKNMQFEYKNQLSITQQQALKKTWFNNHKSKTIEDRKRIIQQILQKLFNHQLIRANPSFLLSHLNLPQKFFLTARRISAQRNSQQILTTTILTNISKIQSMNQNIQWSKKDSLSTKQLKQAVTILCATEIKLGRDIYHDMDQQLQSKKEKAEKVEIYIKTMKQDETVMVKVTEYDTVEDVCNKVSKLIGLRENRDFRLFHEIGKKQLRVLEHEQIILKMFTFHKNKRQSLVQGFFQSMTSSIVKVISPDTQPTLIFKKYYFLPFEIQQRQAKKDLTRLRLLTYQIFSQVHDMKYQLNFQQYLLFCALLIYTQHDGQLNPQTNPIQPHTIHKIIPQTIFKLKNYTQQQWLNKVHPHLLRLQQQIKKVIQYNKVQMKNKRIRTDTQSKVSLYFGYRHLASQLVLSKIKENTVYGSNLFYVQPYKKTYEELKSQGNIKMAYNMWLAVKVNSLCLLTPSSKQTQFQLKYDQIQTTTVYSQAIVFKTHDYINKTYRFNTYQSFEISQLVKYYKVLNEILKQLSQNQSLAEKVRQYRQEVINYRSSMYIENDED